MNPARKFLDAHQLADLLGVKVRYVRAKAASREWPSYLFSEVKFSPEQVEAILAKHVRQAKERDTAQAPEASEPRTRVRRTPPPQVGILPSGVTPLVARTPKRRRRQSA